MQTADKHPATIDDSDIAQLEIEAGAAGDHETVYLCQHALHGLERSPEDKPADPAAYAEVSLMRRAQARDRCEEHIRYVLAER